jgi:6-phosphogluconolactonase
LWYFRFMRNLFFILLILANTATAQNNTFLIGTYTKTGSYGIYVANFNSSTGDITLHDSASIENPSFLAFSPNKKFVYAVVENGVDKPGKVATFTYHAKNKKLQFINEVESGGDHPCHLMVHPSGKALAVANYNGGNFSVIQINADGSLSNKSYTKQHYGSSVDTTRQKSPHVHQVTFSAKGDRLYVTDLGIDKVLIYPITTYSNSITVGDKPVEEIATTPGAGPRHLALSKNNKQVFVLNELSGTVDFLQKKDGKHFLQQAIVSDSISKKPGSAQIILSANNKFVYSSNRADANTITVFANPNGTKLQRLQSISTNGIKPRNFVLSPNEKYMLVANQVSNIIQVFTRSKDGKLTLTDKKINIPSPVCLLFE